MRKLVTMRQALSDTTLLRDALPGPSWHAWRVLLVAMYGEELSADEREVYKQLTGGREREPGEMADVFLAVAGRRSGKSRAAAVACVYAACLVDWSDCLALGERAVAMFVAPSERQAKTVFRYADAIVRHTALLAGLITGRTVDTLSLSTGIDLEVVAASARTTRGSTCVIIVLDETAFLRTNEDSANADTEIVVALKPSLGTTQGLLLMTSSPSQMEGVVFRTHRRHFGLQGDARTIVIQADTRTLNPRFSAAIIDKAMEDDAVAAASEYGAEFRVAMTAYLPRAVIERAVDEGIGVRHPLPGVAYTAFCDVAGGSGSDSFTLAIGHKHLVDGDAVCLIDMVFEVRPSFDPMEVCKRAAAVLHQWGLTSVIGDAYAGSWPTSVFARYGVSYSLSPLTRSEIYLHVAPLFNANRVRLLDHQRTVDQFAGLRRKVGSGGKESVDHVRGAHDDLSNSVSGVLWRLSPVRRAATMAPGIVVTAPIPDAFANNPADTDIAFARASGLYGGGGGLNIATAPPGHTRFDYGGPGI
jgi:hypothetical protein